MTVVRRYTAKFVKLKILQNRKQSPGFMNTLLHLSRVFLGKFYDLGLRIKMLYLKHFCTDSRVALSIISKHRIMYLNLDY